MDSFLVHRILSATPAEGPLVMDCIALEENTCGIENMPSYI
jgi:hypothetical protein